MNDVWSAAAAGLVFKVFFFGQLNPIHNFILYAAASAVGIVSVVRFAWVYGPGTTRWVLACYGSYIAGAYFLLFKPLGLVDGFFGPHEIWHVGVLVGTWCHWAFVLWLTERVSSSAQPLTQVGVQPAELPLSEGVPSSLAPGNPMPSPIGSPAGFSGETSRFIGVVVEAVEESGSSLRSELPQRSPGG